MKYKFHPLAIQELGDAVNYYKKLSHSLGIEFLEEFYSTIYRIQEFPNAWTKISKKCRRCILNRFPYSIIYFVQKNIVVVVAVMQLNRQPFYWENRE